MFFLSFVMHFYSIPNFIKKLLFFSGGVDKQTASKLKIKENTGISGCIKKITLSTDSNWDQTLLVKDASGGANVGQCTQSSLLYL